MIGRATPSLPSPVQGEGPMGSAGIAFPPPLWGRVRVGGSIRIAVAKH